MNIKKLLCSLTLVLAISAGTAFSQNISLSNEDSALIDAVCSIQNGDYSTAISSLKKITASDPTNDAAQYYLGLGYLYSRDIKNAQVAFKAASELDPKNYWYKDRLALAYSLSGEDDLTIATYESLLKDFPKKNDIYYSLVNLYLKQNQIDKALAAMDQIESVFGKSETVTSTKYNLLLRQNKPDEALKVLQDYNSEYSSPTILSQIGDHCMAEYKDSLALGYYREALDLQSNYAPALLGEAEVYRTRRDYPDYFKVLKTFVSDEEAMPESKAQYLNMLVGRSDAYFFRSNKSSIDSLYAQMAQVHPSDSTVLSSCGMYFYSTGDSLKAREMMQANMDKHPESIGSAVTYIQLLGQFKDWDGILAESDKALKRFPEETEFLDLKNYACYNKQDWQGIIDNSRKIIMLAKGDTSKTIPALANIGDMYHEMGNEKEAFKIYKQVLKANPDYIPTLNNYAYYLSLKGKDLKKAYAMSKKTVDKEPDNSTYLDTLGWILHLMGLDKEAKPYFKHALLYGGKDSATCLRHYAIVLDNLGEKDLATVYRDQAAAREAEGKE